MIDRIANDKAFPLTRDEIEAQLDPALYTGRSKSQVEIFLKTVVEPLLDRLHLDKVESELTV